MKTISEDVKKDVSEKFENAKTAITNSWQDAKKVTEEKWGEMITKATSASKDIKETVDEKFGDAKKKVEDAFDAMKKKLSNSFSDMEKNSESSGKGIVKKLQDSIGNMKGTANTWGKDMMQGFINGINNMKQSVGKAASGIAEKVKNFLHFSRPDEGPLREYEKWMPDMVDGLSKTLTASAPKLYEATRLLASKFADEFDMSTALSNMKYTINRPNISQMSLDTASKLDFQPTNMYSQMLDAMSDTSSNSNRPISLNLSVNVGNEKLGKILLNDLRDMKRATGKDIEALVGG